MRVHLIKKQTIEDYVQENAASRIPFSEWLSKLKFADWETAADIKKLLVRLICWERGVSVWYLILVEIITA